MTSTKFYYLVALTTGLCLVFVRTIEAVPMPRYHSNAYYNDFEEPPEDALMDLVARLRQTIIRARDDLENSKRTVDFGLARGYSGIQEAKHRMGLAAANFAGGPGRRRRSETDV